MNAVVQGHRRLVEVLSELTDDQVAAPSLLPGWSRGHVLAHLTDNARAFARVSALALRGELVDAYDGGSEERDAIIEGLAGSSADQHRAAVARHSAALEAVWSQATADDWDRPVRFRNGDLAGIVHMRWREVWIHLVDLDLGVSPREWSSEFSCHVVDFLLSRLPAGVDLRQSDGPRRWSSGGAESDGHVEISGRARDLAAWLAGRTPQQSPAGPLPDLGPWPPHPDPIPDEARRSAS
ncbi:maleylpyruvate isomerase family mycothiol-dependent enzyme [Saccharopolyspora sp. K220]|uniref:maleylpyruvate isomerase family mycothiol-dependent enzyme n=1 Tax=Saccharopolyspora soli TaxID=2926618 RepID=UPI001F56F044|nr:maleylpyruvate isomerase family mycothiol-dependent enzyme [Saccharopolyspora soli]MCI2420838.1 maleylpyruvate isomerase family mycothiol-dependent enzyme [Saccharopolyspora soli]